LHTHSAFLLYKFPQFFFIPFLTASRFLPNMQVLFSKCFLLAAQLPVLFLQTVKFRLIPGSPLLTYNKIVPHSSQ
ncbi:hypothetical protein, partial [Lacrimispora sp.]|uniref:hypothetical protein n=1 Tax=Lacrimispora sp. TaxID=2719234 RepID=UPI0028B00D0E